MPRPRDAIPRLLSIAGSDSGGGAGIQADLKAFARCGAHGMTAVTAITAQSTSAVIAVEPVSPGMIVAQVAAVLDDIGVDAVKVGMLGTAATIGAVARALDLLPAGTPVVVDPVMVAESGAELLAPEARGALIASILPRATVLTPNLPEARAIAQWGRGDARPSADATTDGPRDAGLDPGSGTGAPDEHASPADLARAIHALGPANVVITGGHREEASDLFYDGDALTEIPGARHDGGAAHGSGCTHSSVLAAELALGSTPLDAARRARTLAADAVRDGLASIGRGAGPVDVLGLAAGRDPAETV